MKSYHDITSDGGSDVVGQVTEHAASVASRLADVDLVLAVMSGKGGVGKSTLTAALAVVMAGRGMTVGVLDADLNSSSLARITGVLGNKLRRRDDGYLPAETRTGVKVMSVDLLLATGAGPVIWDAPTQRDAYTWRGMVEMAALREFLADTAWGRLDVLLIDMPPGSDRLPNIADLVPRLDGAVVVSIPTGVSRFVVEKSVRLAKDVAGVRLAGIVENMAYAVCPDCGKEIDLFPSGGVRDLANEFGLPLLGRIPFDKRLAELADDGRIDLVVSEAGLLTRALGDVVNAITNTYPR